MRTALSTHIIALALAIISTSWWDSADPTASIVVDGKPDQRRLGRKIGQDSDYHHHNGVRRRRLKSKSGSGDRGGGLGPPIYFQCVPFDHIDVQEASQKPNTDDDCRTNDCSGGCCRYHSEMLVCDEKGEFAHVACVCNENTPDRDGNVSIPVDIGPVAPTTPAPSAAPVTGQPVAGTPQVPEADMCKNSEVYPQEFFKPCTEASDCDGEVDPFSGEETCCWKIFCYCAGAVEDKCVPRE